MATDSLCSAVGGIFIFGFDVGDLLIITVSLFSVCVFIYSVINLIKLILKRQSSKKSNSLKFGRGVDFSNYNDTNNKTKSMLENEIFYFPDNELVSWIDENELEVEQYMSENQIGRLVKQYMVETNGMPLKIVFPEYDKGDLNEKYFKK